MAKKSILDKSDLKFIGWNVLLALVVGTVILIVLIVWLKGYTQHGKEVEVADVRGMVAEEATAVLEEQGLKMEIIDSTYSDKVPFGTVVEQDPRPASHAKDGRLVYVIINATTKRMVTMPDLQDISYRQAETTLRAMGLRVDTAYDYKPSAFRDLVLEVKSQGETVQPGEKLPVGTRVRLVVGYGRGTEQVTVPQVIGMTLQEARNTLLRNRLTVGAVQYDTPQEEGTPQFVYRQTPAEGEKLVEGETVALRLSPDIEKAVNATGNNSDGTDEWF